MTPRYLDPEFSWIPIAAAAMLSGRTYHTVRRWAHDGHVRARCDIATRQTRVWLWSIFDTDDTTQRRRLRSHANR